MFVMYVLLKFSFDAEMFAHFETMIFTLILILLPVFVSHFVCVCKWRVNACFLFMRI